MFHQILVPVAGSLPWSSALAALPVAVVLLLLGAVRLPAWQAASAGLVTAVVLATTAWQMPLRIAASSIAAGATFALWPVMWIVFNGLILYNLTVISGRFEMFRAWIVTNLPNDRRIMVVVVGFCFGCLLEGVAGYGLPVAITSSLLIAMGFPPIRALVVTLIFNTAPVAFGGLGVPVTTLAGVTQLPAPLLGAMIGRQLPFIALILPFYAIATQEGIRAVRGVWPVLLAAGTSFAIGQFFASNYLSYELTDLVSSLLSLIITLAFVRVWKFVPDERYALSPSAHLKEGQAGTAWKAWAPWLIMVVVVIGWVHLHLTAIGEWKIAWPYLHNQVFITAYNKPYEAIWSFQSLGTGTAISFASVIVAVAVGVSPREYFGAVRKALAQVRMPAVTTALIISLAYLMNYSGLTYTLGTAAAGAGAIFPMVAAFLGWLAVLLSGSDTSGNALFGNLQVVAANRLGLDPILMAATNSSGGVLGKMVSPQNIATGAMMVGTKGREGEILAQTFKHSLILTFLLGLLVMGQQYLFLGMIPR